MLQLDSLTYVSTVIVLIFFSIALTNSNTIISKPIEPEILNNLSSGVSSMVNSDQVLLLSLGKQIDLIPNYIPFIYIFIAFIVNFSRVDINSIFSL